MRDSYQFILGAFCAIGMVWGCVIAYYVGSDLAQARSDGALGVGAALTIAIVSITFGLLGMSMLSEMGDVKPK